LHFSGEFNLIYAVKIHSDFLLNIHSHKRKLKMKHVLPELPYAKDALEPYISAETLDYHHDKHHQAYVTNLNNLIEGTEYADKTLEEIITSAPAGGIYNNGAQVWNHTFYFNCLGPNAGGEPAGAIAEAIKKSFGSFAEFKEKFSTSAVTNFGSGWTWLIQNKDGTVEIANTSNAGCPLSDGQHPVLTIDVWEHAYYVDKRNARPAYVKEFWNLVNWDFVNENLK
jgi:Fe-Mn family superoxide dismutase